MAKAPTPTRAAVTLTGVALLAAIAAAEGGFLMLTQAEGSEIVNEGFAVVDTSIVEGDTAAVRLTEAGTAKLANPEGTTETAPAVASAKPAFEIEDGVEMPTGKVRRGRESGYPFDKLEIGQSFHVAKTDKNEDPAARLASSVSGARVKYSVDTGETETTEKKTYQRGPDGKSYAKDADGKRIVASVETVTVPVLKLTRDFVCKAVDASDPKGEGARVWRVALTD